MTSGTDILFGGTDDGTTSSRPASSAPAGTDILFRSPSADTTTAKPGDIDPITGRPYAFATTANTPVATTLGKPIVEGQQPGPVVQAKIGTATDREQQRRIAAGQLYPDLPLNEALGRVFYGDDGRLAAVGEGGKPFYVEPMPVLSGGPAGERPTVAMPGAPPTPPAPPPNATWEQRVQASMPPGAYGSPTYQPPPGSASPFTPGAITGPNLLQTAGRALPSAATVPPMIAGEALGGPLGLGAASFASDFARQFAANRFDPQPGGNPYDYGTYATNALINVATGAGAKGLTRFAAPEGGIPAGLPAQQAEQARLAQVAKDNDIPIFPQQAPGAGPLSGRVANVAQVLPFSGIPSAYRAQAENITGAAIKEMGDTSGAKALTPDVMANSAVRIGQGLDEVLPKMNAPIIGNPDAMMRLQQTLKDAADTQSTISPSSWQASRNLVSRVIDTAQANGGVLPGQDLQNLVRTNGLLDKAIGGSDPYVADVARQLKSTLIDSAQAAPGAAGDAAKQWQQLRYQYKVMKTLETPAIKNPDNTLTPGALQQAVRNGFGDTAMARGDAGTMGDLAKIAQMTKPLGTSGTAEHSAMYGALASLGSGAMAVPYAGWGPLGIAATGVGLAGATGKALDLYFRRNLVNQLANPGAYSGSSVIAGGAPTMVNLLRGDQSQNQLAAP